MSATLRDRFFGVLVERDPTVKTLKWEFGYMGQAINNWYSQGLPKVEPVKYLEKATSPTSGLFLPAWKCNNKYVNQGEYPKGFVHCAGGLAWPTQGMGLDEDVRRYFNMDRSQMVVDANLLFYPMFDVKIEEDTDDKMIFWDIDGVQKVFLKESGMMPSGQLWPIKTISDWEKLKEERLSVKHIRERLPDDWDTLVQEYKTRDYPLGIGGLPFGVFGTLAHIMGYENLFLSYYIEPEMIKDILQTFTNLWIAVIAEIQKDVQLDFIQFWEDISMNKGSMVSRDIIMEFMVPYYKQIISFGKENNIQVFFVDTDGDCMDIIDLFVESGCNAMYPFEVHAGMDVLEVRKRFPELAVCGGIDKFSVSYGKEKVDEILAHVQEVLNLGGYIPHCDHLVPVDVKLEDFSYYRNKLNDIIEKSGR